MTHVSFWPNPELPGYPLFSAVTSRHVLQDKSRKILKLVLWDHEQGHYCTEIGFMTPKQACHLGLEYYAPCFTHSQISDILAPALISVEEIRAAERERCLKAVEEEQLQGLTSEPDDVAYSNAIRDAMSAIRRLEKQEPGLGEA